MRPNLLVLLRRWSFLAARALESPTWYLHVTNQPTWVLCYQFVQSQCMCIRSRRTEIWLFGEADVGNQALKRVCAQLCANRAPFMFCKRWDYSNGQPLAKWSDSVGAEIGTILNSHQGAAHSQVSAPILKSWKARKSKCKDVWSTFESTNVNHLRAHCDLRIGRINTLHG